MGRVGTMGKLGSMPRARRALVGLAALAAGCPGPPPRPVTASTDRPSRDEETRLTRQYDELQDDILTSYDRDEPLELATGLIDPRIGAFRIGVGPDDVYPAGAAASRWPIEVDRLSRPEVRSKRLEIQIALDQTAGWMSDELSWRIRLCDRTVVIPLRITALYARDGDRWVAVFEHLSFARPQTPIDAPPARPIKTEVASGDLRDELSGVLARSLFHEPHDPLVAAQSGGALVLGPGIADEWHDAQVLQARTCTATSPANLPCLPAGTLEERRVGLVGRSPDTATVAYWIGNYNASYPARPGAPASKAAMRVTHVFEKRWFAERDGLPVDGKSCGLDDGQARDPARRKDVQEHCRWMLVQTHMSQPITDDELTRLVFGTALVSIKPLRLDCASVPARD
jgi:hypothetical protein